MTKPNMISIGLNEVEVLKLKKVMKVLNFDKFATTFKFLLLTKFEEINKKGNVTQQMIEDIIKGIKNNEIKESLEAEDKNESE